MPIGRYASRNLVLHDRTEPEEVRAAAERNNWTFAGEIDRDRRTATGRTAAAGETQLWNAAR